MEFAPSQLASFLGTPSGAGQANDLWPEILTLPRAFRCAAVVLLCAALLKSLSPTTVSSKLFTATSSNWLTGLLIAYEAALGCWLLSGWQAGIVGRLTLVTLSAFGLASIAGALRGDPSCSCFGALHVTPWLTALLDFSIVAMLLRTGVLSQEHATGFVSSRPWRPSAVAVLAISAIGLALASALFADPNQKLEADEVALRQVNAGGVQSSTYPSHFPVDVLRRVKTLRASCPCLSVNLDPPQGGGHLSLDLTHQRGFSGPLRILVAGLDAEGRDIYSLIVRAQVVQLSDTSVALERPNFH